VEKTQAEILKSALKIQKKTSASASLTAAIRISSFWRHEWGFGVSTHIPCFSVAYLAPQNLCSFFQLINIFFTAPK
jgi:hypothetical protein